MSEFTKNLGKAGENFAAKYLEAHGYKIIAQNFRVRYAEIDIIAELDEEIIFVEVKTRSSTRRGLPAESVNLRKQQRIIQAASIFLQDEIYFNRACRFDVIEIYSDGAEFKIRHIENAFEVTSEF